MAPEDASTIEDVIATISKRPHGATLLVVGNFNTDLAALEGRERDEGIAADLVEEGLEDMISHFLPRHKTWLKDACMWAVHRGGRMVRSRTDYILGTDSHMFHNPGHRHLSYPEHSGTGRKEQHGPLPGLRVSPRSHACHAFALPR